MIKLGSMLTHINGKSRRKFLELLLSGEVGAQTIISEIGVDMSRFPTASYLCSWAGVAPCNNESADKRRSGRTTKGNITLKTTLIQCAHGASKRKGTFFYAQYQRISEQTE